MNRIKRNIAYECKYYIGDRPCIWHKKTGVLCECKHYIQLKGTLLIIKLDAIGDVLRTTCLLPEILNKWPNTNISWITRHESIPLLENNPYITEAIPFSVESMVHLSARTFDRVINLDAGKISSGMAAMANANEKIGYVLHEKGYVTATNPEAEHWLRLGIFDDIKKKNTRTYQVVMCSILGLPSEGMKYVLELTDYEKNKGRDHLLNYGVDLDKTIIGIHTGGGTRWRLKQWNEDKFIQLISELLNDLENEVQILLFGGTAEKEQNNRIINKVKGPVYDTGCDNTIRHFAALANCCSLVLSGDSLAMHVALAMGCRVVVLFGPTSNSEIELFGQGEKVIPDIDCLVCYKRDCDFKPNCMDSISADMVKKAVLRQLELI